MAAHQNYSHAVASDFKKMIEVAKNSNKKPYCPIKKFLILFLILQQKYQNEKISYQNISSQVHNWISLAI